MTISTPLARGDIPDLGAAARWPEASTARGGRAGGAVQLTTPDIIEVLGVPGQKPTSQQYALSFAALNNFPSQDFNYGIWANAYNWQRLIGGAFPGNLHIWVEFHSAATIQALAPSTPGVVAYTALGSQPGLPPQSGKTWGGQTPAVMGYNVADSIRILIRSDLVTATSQTPVGIWFGPRGFVECLTHELGHAAMLCLENLYGTDYLQETVCDIFGRPTSEWNPTGLAWDSRVVEAAAETFKDIAYPNSLYNNRTKNRISQFRFQDFIQLFWGFLETPVWDYTDGFSPFFYTQDTFHAHDDEWIFVNNGILQANLQFATDAYVRDHPTQANFFTKRPFKWPREGDDFRIRWNFNLPPFKPRPVGSTFGLHPGATLDWGDYDPTYEAKLQLGALFYPIGQVGAGPPIGSDVFEINPVNNAVGWGEHTITFPGGLPEEGCDVAVAISGSTPLVGAWINPRPSPAFDGTTLPIGDTTSPMDYLRPYVEYTNGVKLARWPLPDITWPYTVPKPLPGTIGVGGGGGGGIV